MSLTYDPAVAIAHLRGVDARLGVLIDQAGPFTLTPAVATSPFHALMRSIVYQQLSGKAAGTILGRVLALMPHGRGRPRPADLLALADEPANRSRPQPNAISPLQCRGSRVW